MMAGQAKQRRSDAEQAKRLNELVAGMPTTILVRNSGPFKGRLL